MWSSKTYVKCMMGDFKNTFDFYTSKQHADIPTDYKPDLETTDL